MSHTLRICITLACLALCAGHLRAQAAAKPVPSTSPGASLAASPTPSPTPISLPDVVTEANSTAKTLRGLSASLFADEVRTKTMDQLPALTSDIDMRTAETNKILAGSPSLEVLGELDKEWQSLGDSAQSLSRDLVRRATGLDGQLAQLTRLTDTWRVTAASAKAANLPPETSNQINSVMGSIQQTHDGLENRRAEILSFQSRLATQENRIETAEGLIRQAREQAASRLWERGSPPSGNSGMPENPAAIWPKRAKRPSPPRQALCPVTSNGDRAVS
jgi:hypothetical protein